MDGIAIPHDAGPAPPGARDAPFGPADDWPQFHCDANRTGATGTPAPAANSTIWRLQTGGAVNASPALDGGTLFVGSMEGSLYALNGSTGEPLWKGQTGGPVCSPAVADGLVYVGSDDGGLHCFYENNGTEFFNFSAGAPVRSPVLLSSSTVLFGTDSGGLFALGAGGALIWSNTTPYPIRKAQAAAGGLVFVVSGPRLSAFYLNNGTRAWYVAPGTGNLSHPAVAAGRVYVGSEEGFVNAYDTASGAPAWSSPVQGAVASCPAISSGGLYIGTKDKRFYRLEASDGSATLNISVDGAVDSSPAVSGQTVVFGSSAGLTAINGTSGALLWNYAVPGGVGSSPAISRGRAYIGTASGAIMAFGSRHTAKIQSAGPTPVPQGGNVSFNGSSPDCIPITYQWRSSLDGPMSGKAMFKVSTMTLGIHLVSFRIQDENWTWSDWDSATIEVVPSVDWPMFKKDTSHRGFSEGEAPATNTIVWNTDVLGQAYASPVVYRGMVFIGTRDPNEVDSTFYALDVDTGTKIWSYPSTNSIWGTAACADGLVFVVDTAGNVIAFEADPRDGIDDGAPDYGGKERDIIWYRSGMGSITGSPVVANGKVIVPSKGNARIYALDELNNGTPLWNFSLPDANNDSIWNSPAVDSGLVLFGSSKNRLYALDLETGREVWNFSAKAPIREGSPCIYNGTVYFGSWDYKLYALNLKNGTKKWEFTTGAYIDSSPAVAGGKVLFGSDDTKFRALDAETGQEIWTCSTIGGYIDSSPAVGGGLAFFTARDGKVYAINATTGNLAWTYNAGPAQSLHSSPALVDGRLYVSMEGTQVGGRYVGTVMAFGKAPDLYVPASEINFSASRPLVGQLVTVKARVYNIGTLNATAQARISDGLPGEELSRTSISVPSGGWVEVSANWTVGPGVHRIVVNVTDTVPYEAYQANNVAFKEYVPPAQSGWTMFKYSPERASTRNNVTTPNSNNLTWEFDTHAEGFSSPLTAGTRVYQAAGNAVFALDSRTGDQLWRYDAGGTIRSTPAVSNLVVFGSSDGMLTAVNEWDGALMWSAATGAEVFSSPVIASDTVFIGSGDGYLYSFSLYDGRPLWKKHLGGAVLSSPAYDAAGDMLVVGCQYGEAGRVWCLYSNGTEVWNLSVPAQVISSPAISSGTAYVGADNGVVYALEVVPDGRDEGLPDAVNSTYDILWKTNLSLYVRGDDYRVRSSPAIYGGSVFVGAGYNTIIALDGSGGKVLWYRDLGSPASDKYQFSSPSVSDGRLFVGGPGVFSLNTRNGGMIWSYTPGSWVWSSPAVALQAGSPLKGVVYAVTEDGRLCAFSSTISIPPIAHITTPLQGQEFRAGEHILFNGSASWDPDGTVVNYTWIYGDGNFSYDEVASHEYTMPGEYNISLTVRDDTGLEGRAYADIGVRNNSAPVLRFPLVTPENGDVNALFTLKVTYSDADNDTASYVWARAGDQAITLFPVDYTDNNNVDGRDYFCETTLLSGIFGVYFEASDGVLVNRTPVAANLTVTNRSIFVYDKTMFVEIFYAGRGEVRFNSSSFLPHGPPSGLEKVTGEVEISESNIDRWWWANITVDFPPNMAEVNPSSLRIYRWNPNWTLAENAGIDMEHNRTFANVTSFGLFVVLAQPPINHAPVARLGKDITIMEGETAFFNASASYDPDGNALKYCWTFGDSPGKPPVPGDRTAEHKYAKPGRYTVTVLVFDGKLNGSAQVTVTVKQKGGEQFVIVIVVIIVLVVGIIFILPRGDKERTDKWKEEEFQKGMDVKKKPPKKATAAPAPASEEE